MLTALQIQLALVIFVIEIEFEGGTVLWNGSPTFANHHYHYIVHFMSDRLSISQCKQ